MQKFNITIHPARLLFNNLEANNGAEDVKKTQKPFCLKVKVAMAALQVDKTIEDDCDKETGNV